MYYNAVVLMGLCTVLMLLVLKGSRNLTTLAIIPLICFAIAKTALFKWKGGKRLKIHPFGNYIVLREYFLGLSAFFYVKQLKTVSYFWPQSKYDNIQNFRKVSLNYLVLGFVTVETLQKFLSDS